MDAPEVGGTARLTEGLEETESENKVKMDDQNSTPDIKTESAINSLSNSNAQDNMPREKVVLELKDFDQNVIDRFLRKYGAFARQGSLSKKERKRLQKFSLLEQKNDCPKRKYRPKRKEKGSEKKMSESNCKQRVVFDLSYFNENLMRHVDMKMCIKQIHRCYSDNRRLPDPLQFHVTSVTEKAEEILAHNAGYQNWDVGFHEKSFMEVFKKEEIVYLTSESENVIDSLDATKVYIIGGLLDHNSLKGLSYNRAVSQDISHGRLPIDQYMNMKTLKVLPINHVYSLLASVASGKSWSEALVETIPQRKEATPISGAEIAEITENKS